MRTKSRYGEQYYIDCKALFDRLKIMGGDLEGYELAEAMYDMDKKYPCLGWDVEAKKILHKYYAERGVENPQNLV